MGVDPTDSSSWGPATACPTPTTSCCGLRGSCARARPSHCRRCASGSPSTSLRLRAWRAAALTPPRHWSWRPGPGVSGRIEPNARPTRCAWVPTCPSSWRAMASPSSGASARTSSHCRTWPRAPASCWSRLHSASRRPTSSRPTTASRRAARPSLPWLRWRRRCVPDWMPRPWRPWFRDSTTPTTCGLRRGSCRPGWRSCATHSSRCWAGRSC